MQENKTMLITMLFTVIIASVVAFFILYKNYISVKVSTDNLVLKIGDTYQLDTNCNVNQRDEDGVHWKPATTRYYVKMMLDSNSNL